MGQKLELTVLLTVDEISDILEALEADHGVYSEPTETAKLKLLHALKDSDYPDPEAEQLPRKGY
jgi:hypothetical protein